ncbi:MAG: hypothetical protein AB8B62_02785 [Roseobacter sp.]
MTKELDHLMIARYDMRDIPFALVSGYNNLINYCSGCVVAVQKSIFTLTIDYLKVIQNS